jgi:hypothetical protein
MPEILVKEKKEKAFGPLNYLQFLRVASKRRSPAKIVTNK